MHIFVTGGTGTIGSNVIPELLRSNHSVLALARSQETADSLRTAGAEVIRGELSDHDILRRGAEQTDGVVHLAFGRDYSDASIIAKSIEDETAASNVIADVLKGTKRPFVLVSGTPWIPGRVSDENDPPPTDGLVGARGVAVKNLLAQAPNLRTIVVRMPRTVHDHGKGGFAGLLTDMARASGVAGYPGDGTQRWPAVHGRDVAVLIRLALESAPAGTSLNAVADEGDTVLSIATVIGRRLGLPVRSLPTANFGPFGELFATDQPASSLLTRQMLAWTPSQPNLLSDLEHINP